MVIPKSGIVIFFIGKVTENLKYGSVGGLP